MSEIGDLVLKFLRWLWDKLPPPLRLPVVSFLTVGFVAAVWRYYAYAVPLRKLPRDRWVLGAAAVALVAALLWVLSRRLYTRLTKPRPKPTPAGKLGFYVARIEGDTNNRRQANILGEIYRAMYAHPDLRGRFETHDLTKTIPHGSPDDQAYEARQRAKGVNAFQVISP